MLVHGDVQQWNALRAGDGFKLVDPDGPLAADPLSTARWMGRRYDLDATAIFEWAVIERVSTGLLATQIELQPVGRQMLELADRLALAP